MERNPISSKKLFGAKASDGVSSIAPISSPAGSAWPRRFSMAMVLSTCARAARYSSACATKGNMIVNGRPAAARIRACSCIRMMPGLSSPTRIARQPSAGFGSSLGFM